MNIEYKIRQLADELQPPESGKLSIVLHDDANTKAVLFAFAAGSGLSEHVAPFLRQQRKGVMVMAKQQKAWMPKPEKIAKTSVPDAIKSDLESKAANLIETVLKPKHVVPQKPEIEFNYISDIGTKWYRKYFYFFSTYTCPGPNAISPSFESEFARMEYVGAGRFSLSFHRHTDQWVKLYAAQTIQECLKVIKEDAWFTP